MAGNSMVGFNIYQLGLNLETDIFGIETAWVEMTTGRGINWGGYFSREYDFLTRNIWIRGQCRRKERLSIWMNTSCIYLLAIPILYYFAQIHNSHPVAHVPDNSKVMGNN